MSSVRLYVPKDILPYEARENTLKKVSEVLFRFPKGVPLLDPEEDMKVYYFEVFRNLYSFFSLPVLRRVSKFDNTLNILQVQSSTYRKAVRRIEALESLFDKHEIAKSPLIEEKLKMLHKKHDLTTKIKSIRKTMGASTSLAFKDELKAKKRVLRRLG